MSTLFDVWNTIQTELFPSFELEIDLLTEKEREAFQAKRDKTPKPISGITWIYSLKRLTE